MVKLLLIRCLVGLCVWSLFCCALLVVFSGFVVVLTGWRELLALLWFSSWFLVAVGVLWLFLAVPWVGLRCVVVVFPNHAHLLFANIFKYCSLDETVAECIVILVFGFPEYGTRISQIKRNTQTSRPAYSVGPPSTRYRNDMAFH